MMSTMWDILALSKMGPLGWENDSAVKRYGYSSRELVFHSQNPHKQLISIHNSTCNGSNAFSFRHQAYDVDIYIGKTFMRIK